LEIRKLFPDINILKKLNVDRVANLFKIAVKHNLIEI